MKELIHSNVTIEQFNNSVGLTTHPFPPKLEGERNIFSMDAGRPTEGPPRPSVPTIETESTAQLFQETGVNTIQNPAQLIAFVSKFRKESEQAPSKNPFKDWSIDRLKKQYLAWHVNTLRIEKQQKTFGEKVAISGHAQQYSAALMEELERRNVDMRGLFLEATKRSAEEGAEAGSIGAAKADIPITDYSNPALQNIARELQNEIDRVGEGESPDITFGQNIQENIDRVRGLSDSTPGIPADEAIRLLGNLNRLRAEYNAAARAEAGERSQYFTGQQVEIIKNIKTNRIEGDKIFEDIFAGPDAAPGLPFDRVFSFHEQGKWADFITLIKGLGDESLTREYSARREIRGILHDANWGVSGGGNIQAFANAAQTYKDEYTDLIFQDPLVESALHFFEQGFQQIKADNNGQLPYEKLEWNFKRRVRSPGSDIEDLAKPGSDLEDMVFESMKNAIQTGVVKEVEKDEKSGKITFEGGIPKLKSVDKAILNPGNEWRLRRAIVLARGFGVLSLRFPEIAAEARLPEEKALSDPNVAAHRSASIYGESVSAYLDPKEHLIEKFGIGGEDRAFLYYFLTGDKQNFQSKESLQKALDLKKSEFTPGDQRLIDQINYFQTGGPFSRSSWRTRVSFAKLPGEDETVFKKRLERAGIGVLEAQAEGDVDYEIKMEVKRGPKFADKSDADIEGKYKKEFNNAVKAKSDEIKEHLLLEKRLAMWKNTLKSNPLRVMWEWENKERQKKNPGQRIRFLSEALGVNENRAKQLIGQVEKDLMLLQEEVVSSRKPISANEEMLNYKLIGDETDETPEGKTQGERAKNVRLYVEKIRKEAREDDYKFFRTELLRHSRVTDTPFPFVVGFEDIPFAEYDFINSGGRGMSRKINDFARAYTASTELIELITGFGTAQSIEPLIGHLTKIKNALSQVDSDLAMELIPPIAEGIIRMYDKEWVAKMPFGIGTLVGLIGDTSFIQQYKGGGAMSWDEGDKYRFTKHLLQNSLGKRDEIEALRWRTGSTVFHMQMDFVRTYGQLMLLLMALEFAGKTAKGK